MRRNYWPFVTSGIALVGLFAPTALRAAQDVPATPPPAPSAEQSAAPSNPQLQVPPASGAAPSRGLQTAPRAGRDNYSAPDTSQRRASDRGATDRARQYGRDAADDARTTARDSADQAADDVRSSTRRTVDDAQSQGRYTRDSARDSDASDRAGADIRRDSTGNRRNNLDARARGSARGGRNLGLSFSAETQGRLAVNNVERNSVFARAGVRRGDVIVSIGGRPVRTRGHIDAYLYGAPIRDRVAIVVLRDGAEETVYIEPDWIAMDAAPAGGAYLGVGLDQRFQDRAIVSDVRPGTPAEEAGLQPGDEILAVEGEEIRSPDHLTDTISSYSPGDRVQIELGRGRRVNAVAVELAARRHTVSRPVYDEPPAVPPAPSPLPPAPNVDVGVAPAQAPATVIVREPNRSDTRQPIRERRGVRGRVRDR